MRKMIRKLDLAISLIVVAIMIATGYGEKNLPDRVTTCADTVRFSFLYSVKNEKREIPVSAEAQPENRQATIRLLETIPVKTVSMEKTDRRYVLLGGDLIGITLQTDGVLIVGTESFSSGGNNVSPGEEAGLKPGDTLLSVNGKKIVNNQSFTKEIEASGGKELQISYSRNGVKSKTVLRPHLSDLTGQYKCGVWIRDCTNGIGTLTYTDIANGAVASLGHGIYDVDTKGILSASGGEFRSASIVGITKSVSGAAGEIKGILGDAVIGTLCTNCDSGVYGLLSQTPQQGDLVPVAMPDEIRIGPAQIVSTLCDGKRSFYDIEIEKVNRMNDDGTRNLVVKVTDPDLISQTGGIVQGMSGSPIIQDGMLVGAVTHVFLNDPLKGYGIFAENMLEYSDALCEDIAA